MSAQKEEEKFSLENEVHEVAPIAAGEDPQGPPIGLCLKTQSSHKKESGREQGGNH